MSNKPLILIVDDDSQLAEMLLELLQLEGYSGHHCEHGEAALRYLRDEQRPEAIILDVMMPGPDGFETLQRIRTITDTPVLMLTARGEADDRIRGLEFGADDYLPKPFKPRELLLRLDIILRRKNARHTAAVLSFDVLELDTTNLRASVADEPLSLTGAELKILEALMRHAGEIATRDDLSQFALGRRSSPYDRALDTHISNLRSKLGDTNSAINIKSIRGKGYTLLLETTSQ
ncbi:MAG: response regulator transcription factor [Pseudomonadota bacterium]